MTTCFLAPDPIQSCQLIPGGNTPANGGQLFFYLAGTSTKTTVYRDPAAVTAWSNPIVLDSGGNLPSGGEVWIPTGITVKVVFAPSNDTDPPASPYWSRDNLSGINDVSATISEWQAAGTPTFVSASSFTFASDQTTVGAADVGRRMRFVCTAGTVYGNVLSRVFGGGLTTVVVQLDSGVLDSGLSAAAYSLLTAAHPAVPVLNTGRRLLQDPTDPTKAVSFDASLLGASTVATVVISNVGIERTVAFVTAPLSSTGALTLFASNIQGDYLDMPLTTQAVTSISMYTGTERMLRFVTSTPIALSSSLVGPYGQSSGSFTTAPGDTALLRSNSTGVQILNYEGRGISGIGGQALRFMAATTLSNSLTAQFTSVTGYDEYRLFFSGVNTSTGSNTLRMRMSNDGGVTWVSNAAYSFATQALGSDGNNYSQSLTAQTAFLLNNTTSNTIQAASTSFSSPGLCGEVTLLNWNSLSKSKAIMARGFYDGSAAAATFTGFAFCNTSAVQSTAANAVQVFFNSGTISSGSINLYGVKNF